MKTNNISLRILFVEDLPEDVEIAHRTIKRENIEFEYRIVDTKPDLLKELESFQPGLIISDYAMPEFDGMTALRLVREKAGNIPFIMLTGSMNEETAVECMKAGADDYVLKEKIVRLPFAIQEVLEKYSYKKEKEKIEIQLRESEKKFRDLFYNHSSIKLIIDPDSQNITEANPAAAKFYGWTVEELEQMKISDINVLSYKEIDVFIGQVKDKVNANFEFKHRKADGTVCDVEVFSSEVKIGEKIFIHSIIHDITGRKRAETTQKFLYNISKYSILQMDLRAYLQIIHEELKNIMIAENFFIALYNSELDKYTLPYFADQYDDLETDEPIPLKNTLTDLIRQLGEPKLLTEESEREVVNKYQIDLVGKFSPSWMGAPIKGSANEVIGVIGLQDYKNSDAYNEDDLKTLNIISNNIGIFIERINNLEKLRLLEQSIEQNPVSIIITDYNGKIEYVNPAFTSSSKYKFEDVAGKQITKLNSGYQSDEFYDKLWSKIRAGYEWQGELLNKTKFGEQYWVKAVISPIFDKNGNISHFVSVNEDITDKKKMIRDLVDAKEKAEESDRLKTAFLTNLSHEIRTPMNGIMGFTNLLMEHNLSIDEITQYSEIIHASGQRLMDTVNDIVEISKIQTGIITVEKQNFDINKCIYDLVNYFKPEANSKNLEILFEQPLDKDYATVYNDPGKFESMISNLIKNAIKYTDEGSVRIGTELKDKELKLYVSDTGTGIPENRQNAIFNRFEQADISNTRTHEGSGLGLAITKAYAEMLNGRVWLESKENVGSTFFIAIDLSEA